MPPISSRKIDDLQPLANFTVDEIIKSLKKSKSKMSSGPDTIPMKIVKAYGLAFPDVYAKIFNDVIKKGLPRQWKTARVVPVPKKGNLCNVTNYRPVSNLCSLSKILERCVLNRLNACSIDLVGPHQHGFRDLHSTTTCVMELKDNIAELLDKKKTVLVYSLDLSAAFDLLRPDVLFDKFVGKLPDGLLRFIMDFLSDRKFFVNIGRATSEVRGLDRGCPQGSVLGPVLFSMYIRDMVEVIPVPSKIVSYADDSYVICSGSSVQEAVECLENTVKFHMKALFDSGMVVNESKTEVVHFRRGKEARINEVLIGNTTMQTLDKMKCLGIVIDAKLNWTQHVHYISNKIKGLMQGLRIIRRKLDFNETLTLVTAQVLSVLYYGCQIWLTPNLLKSEMRKAEGCHYRALRISLKDVRQRMSRDRITLLTKRMPPKTWMRYAACSLAIKIRLSGKPDGLQSIFDNTFGKSRSVGRLFGYDNSSTKVGRCITKNWIGSTLGMIKQPWTESEMNSDQLRIFLKKTFVI